MRRFGVNKLQNIIQKVLASHAQKAQEKLDSKQKELKPKAAEEDPEVSNIDPMLQALKDSESKEDSPVPENKEDKKFFKLMNKLLHNGTVPKKGKVIRRGSDLKSSENEPSSVLNPHKSGSSPLKFTFKGILDKILDNKHKYDSTSPVKGINIKNLLVELTSFLR